MKIRTRLTGFFLLTLTVWSLFLVWVNLEFYRRERSHFLIESFNQRLSLMMAIIAGESRDALYRGLTGDELAAAKLRALELVRAADMPNYTDGYPMIFDSDGKLLYQPEYVTGETGLPPPELEVERLYNYGFGDFNLRLSDGRRRHVICGVVPTWHWVVFYSFPSERASWREVAMGARTRLGVTAIGCVLLSAVLLFFIIRRSLKPIDRLTLKAEAVASGKFPPPEPFYPPDEFGALSRAFDDMSERLRASNETSERVNRDNREVRNFLAAIFNSVDLLVAAVDRDHKITFFNRSIALYAGGGPAAGGDLWRTLPWLAAERGWLEAQLRDQVSRERLGVRFVIGGAEYWFDVLTTPLHDAGVPGAVLILKNVTAMMRQQEQLLQAQKLETIGTLTGGIAHDFNNVLAGIRGALSMIRLAPDNPEQVGEFTGIAESAVERAAGLISQLLALARKTPFAPAVIDWSERIRAVAAIARGSFGAGIRLDLVLPADPAWIEADPVQMEQVILNLAVNAEQAVRASGRTDGAVAIGLEPVEEGRRWEMRVSDNGTGIAPEVIGRIFDPFFSTRATGRGTGLGLAMVYTIVDRHAGEIRVESEPGRGTVFRIRLAARQRPPAAPEPLREQARAVRPETVLVVDDEEAILRGVAGLLGSFGCHVFTASGGREALEIFREHGDAIGLVILDMAMPGMGGDEVYRELAALRPGLRVVLHSGRPDDPRIAPTLAAGAAGLLVKPASPEEFRRLIQAPQ